MNVDSFWWRIVNVFFSKPSDQILTNDTVKCPAFVTPRHLLPHSCQEALGIEEPSHPEHLIRFCIILVRYISLKICIGLTLGLP